MFTGIVATTGSIFDIKPKDSGCLLAIETDLSFQNVNLGDSISIDGACHSVVAIYDNKFEVFSSIETLQKTIVQQYITKQIVNLELPLKVGDFLGGHNVTGHIDGVGIVKNIEKDNNGMLLEIEIENDFAKYAVHKGSITINGISLTVNKMTGNLVSLYIIPVTIEKTNIKYLKNNDFVNFEVDIMAKYIEAYLKKY